MFVVTIPVVVVVTVIAAMVVIVVIVVAAVVIMPMTHRHGGLVRGLLSLEGWEHVNRLVTAVKFTHVAFQTEALIQRDREDRFF